VILIGLPAVFLAIAYGRQCVHEIQAAVTKRLAHQQAGYAARAASAPTPVPVYSQSAVQKFLRDLGWA
jgi:hypothetical protein